ncbi:LINE-1 retrotransposable element ORF2 protein [Labeo rohita]|uniref:LINE-1 retrotransposable element ORF2 protein n=1 Tax=Labeo rohita TaxID=84645 RepID=A0ABQ8LAW7_LABRO|nr:LINE-1 retrotransposable element ORF2 protein [Labeo rohita]
MQLLAYFVVNNKDLEGIKVCDTEMKMMIQASGLCLNLKKCEILPLYNCIEKDLEMITVKNDVKYLGIHLSKNLATRESKNITEKIEEVKRSLNLWLTRDLTILGRNLLSKSEGISKLIYPSYSLYISSQNIRKANTIIYQFIWRGLKTIDFESVVGVFRVNWCDFEVSKLPVKLSEYHKQVLHYWKMVFAHNFSPHGSTLWNNRVMTKNILDEQGHFLRFTDFKTKFNIQSLRRDYNKVCKAIPAALLKIDTKLFTLFQKSNKFA